MQLLKQLYLYFNHKEKQLFHNYHLNKNSFNNNFFKDLLNIKHTIYQGNDVSVFSGARSIVTGCFLYINKQNDVSAALILFNSVIDLFDKLN